MFDKEIQFSAPKEYFELKEDYPIQAKLNIPDWYKKLEHTILNRTVKGCMPFLDTLTSGYLLKMPQDFFVRHNTKRSNTEYMCNTHVLVSKQSQQQYWTDTQLGLTRWSISPAGANPEMIKVEIPAAGKFSIPASAYQHLNGQTIWLLSGQLDIQIDTQHFHLDAGDCIALTAPAHCQLTNPNDQQPCVYIVSFSQKQA
jgi:mannose-6-phosphate isomerase-like protein (cupin superfamily)